LTDGSKEYAVAKRKLRIVHNAVKHRFRGRMPRRSIVAVANASNFIAVVHCPAAELSGS
jgi:hypothetical protein